MSFLGYYTEKPKVTRFPTFQSQSTGPQSPRTPPANVRWSSTSNKRAAPSKSEFHEDVPNYHERPCLAPSNDPFVTPQNFDEYGAELDANARVWKTYVKESDEFDMDLVDGWNRFVLESSKLLQEDPADATAQTLETISQTLLFIAHGNESIAAQSTGLEALDIDNKEFVPDPVAVCINVLWFLSLALSVAASLTTVPTGKKAATALGRNGEVEDARVVNVSSVINAYVSL
ncbi:ribonuclease [Rhizoctonia solani]|uniref:Ribonuclease n=1 Tax=Rhizoctonia solani TaxID=456999 RepID=A0A8H8SYU0_9AGAM|nr:ribonuclease [Rhizoctonia solani]QRW23606.1 ribonuclease [Rhizoctonia solani]